MPIILLNLSCIICANNLCAEDIYSSESKSGVIVYSNKAGQGINKVATLPAIIKQKNLYNTQTKAAASCSANGGIDCSKGADSDGSVICYNGFRDSLERYAFSCSRAKLKIIDQSLTSQNGKTKFVVRNMASVDAKNISIQSKLCRTIEGPNLIAAYDSAEFICDAELKNTQSIKIECENC